MLRVDTEEGGMKMISIENQHKMFLAKWTAKVLGDKKTVRSQIAKHCFTPFVSMHSALITTVDSKHNQARNKRESHFWREAIKATTLMNTDNLPWSVLGQNRYATIRTSNSKATTCSTATGVKQELFIYKIFGSMVTS